VTPDDVIGVAKQRPRVFEHYLAVRFDVPHREVRTMLRELADAGHLVGGRRRGYGLAELSETDQINPEL
jgi:hypothetical protein